MPRKGDVKSLVGMRFGRLVVESFAGINAHRHAIWLCRCDCGGETTATSPNLNTGRSGSCGCLHLEEMKDLFTTHGHASGSGSPEYESWCAMWSRVRATSGERWDNYGRRGITACERWLSFENFLSDTGPRPSLEHSIDRIDNDGNYEPENCRWATDVQQANNRRPPERWSKPENRT